MRKAPELAGQGLSPPAATRNPPMPIPHRHLPCSAFLLVAIASAPAQSPTVPGAAAAIEGQQHVTAPFGARHFRTQLLVEPTAIASTVGFVTGLRFRADRSILQWVDQTVAATTVPNVTISLSHSTRTLATVSEDFATNVTEAPTVVFQGTVTMPGYTLADVRAGALPWDIHVVFQTPFVFQVPLGHLLVDIVADNPLDPPDDYWLDAAEAGGSATAFGRRGLTTGGDEISVTVGTGSSFAPLQIRPGNTLDFVAASFTSTPAAALAFGLTGLAQPLDLAFVGAPGQIAYLAPDVLVPLAWTPGFLGNFATVPLPIPANPSLTGTVLYAQAIAADPTANPFGCILTDAVEVRLGSASDTLPVRQVDSLDPIASSGTVLDFGFGVGTPRFGCVAFQLEGAFQ